MCYLKEINIALAEAESIESNSEDMTKIMDMIELQFKLYTDKMISIAEEVYPKNTGSSGPSDARKKEKEKKWRDTLKRQKRCHFKLKESEKQTQKLSCKLAKMNFLQKWGKATPSLKYLYTNTSVTNQSKPNIQEGAAWFLSSTTTHNYHLPPDCPADTHSFKPYSRTFPDLSIVSKVKKALKFIVIKAYNFKKALSEINSKIKQIDQEDWKRKRDEEQLELELAVKKRDQKTCWKIIKKFSKKKNISKMPIEMKNEKGVHAVNENQFMGHWDNYTESLFYDKEFKEDTKKNQLINRAIEYCYEEDKHGVSTLNRDQINSNIRKYIQDNPANLYTIKLLLNRQKSLIDRMNEKYPEWIEDVFGSIDIKDIDLAMKNIKKEKMPGTDSILNEMWKVVNRGMRFTLARLFNTLLTSGCMPNSWKQGILV